MPRKGYKQTPEHRALKAARYKSTMRQLKADSIAGTFYKLILDVHLGDVDLADREYLNELAIDDSDLPFTWPLNNAARLYAISLLEKQLRIELESADLVGS